MTTLSPTPIHKAVQEHYGNLAKETGSCCEITGGAGAQNLLYPQDLLTGLPSDIANFTAGSGDPISLAKLQPGETVLDLGSGAGLDCFLAAKQVGESGRAIGVDMTPEMLARARSGAERLKLQNVEFREGFLENLPVDDNSVDVIISNCVINLSPDKPQVLREMYRTLKPGGRIAISDTVANHAITDKDRKNNEQWCACVSGAMVHEDYVNELRKAGFEDVQVKPNLEQISKDFDSGRLRTNRSKQQVLEDFQHWENIEKTIIIPNNITARKPA